ncbi:MAG: tetratricopeptide repeat protein, partial [Cyanobacteria bacterium J06648_10]
SELGYAHFFLNEYDASIDYLQQALPLFRAVGDRPGEAAVLNNMGRAASLAEEFAIALRAYQQALTVFRELNRPVQEAHLWVNVAQAHVNAGHTSEAINAFQQAIELTEMIRQQQASNALPARLEAAYRELAVLLQQSDRATEATQVLDLI